MRLKIKISLLLTFVSFMLVGCGPAYNIAVIQPVSANLSQYRTAMIQVVSNGDIMGEFSDYKAISSEVKEVFTKKLTKTGRFAIVTEYGKGEKPEAAIIIKLTVVSYERLSGGASVMFGVMSGNGSIKLREELIDANSGATIGKYQSDARTKSSGGIFRGSTSTLIALVSENLINDTIVTKMK